jgi:hypothetical protein
MKSSPAVAAGGGGHSQQNGGPAGGGVDSHNSHPPRQQQHRPDPQHHQPQPQQSAATAGAQKSDPANKSGGMSGPCYEKPQGVQHTLQVPPTAAPRRSMSGQAGPPSAAQRGAAGAASRRTRFALQVRRIFMYNFISKHLLKLGLKIRSVFLHIFQQNAGQVYITVCYMYVWRQESTVLIFVSAPAPGIFIVQYSTFLVTK